MAESSKRTECVKVCFEERLFIDLNREAIRQDRKLSELIYVLVRKWAYGNLNGAVPIDQGTEGATNAP